MFLTTAPPLRRGSTPLPVKHQLRREEAVSEDCDWIPGLDEPTTLPITDTGVPRDDSFSQSAAAQPAYHSHGGALRIVLLGQNGVGKSSLALSLAGQSDRSLSIDSETQACGNNLNREWKTFFLSISWRFSFIKPSLKCIFSKSVLPNPALKCSFSFPEVNSEENIAYWQINHQLTRHRDEKMVTIIYRLMWCVQKKYVTDANAAYAQRHKDNLYNSKIQHKKTNIVSFITTKT